VKVTPRLRSRRGHGRGNIEELEIDKNPRPARGDPIQQPEIFPAHEQLEPELVERHRIAELLDQGTRFGGSGDIEREDQALVCGDVFRRHVDGRGHVVG
jgi:hypothetical protein